jgi:hypothetical protein
MIPNEIIFNTIDDCISYLVSDARKQEWELFLNSITSEERSVIQNIGLEASMFVLFSSTDKQQKSIGYFNLDKNNEICYQQIKTTFIDPFELPADLILIFTGKTKFDINLHYADRCFK